MLSSLLDGTSLNGNEVVYTKIVHLKKKTALFCYVQARAFENTATYEKLRMVWHGFHTCNLLLTPLSRLLDVCGTAEAPVVQPGK